VAVCRILQLQFCDGIFRAASRLCEDAGLYDEANQCLLALRDPSNEMILLASRYDGPANKKAEFYMKVGIRSQEAFAAAAEQAVKDGKQVDAVTSFVAAGQYDRALSVGLEYLRELLSGNSWALDDAYALITPLNCINLAAHTNTISTEQRNTMLAYSYYLGAHQAMQRGYSSIVSFLFDALHAMISGSSGSGAVNFPLPQGLLRLQEAAYFQSIDAARAATLLRDVMSEGNLHAKYKTVAGVLKKNVDSILAGSPLPHVASSKHLIIPAGSLLPTGGLASKPILSVISRTPITGQRVCIDQAPNASAAGASTVLNGVGDPNAGYISLAEAIMLQQCTPYSPNHTGQRMKVHAST